MPIPVGPAAYDPQSLVGQVRLLLNDVDPDGFVFGDDEISAFLVIEGQNVKRAAAQAIDTNADNEALASKVLRTQDLQTSGDKLAAALHQRAESLRAQAVADEQADGYFEVVDTTRDHWRHDELAEIPVTDVGWPSGWLI